ncbi:hypothetical protein HELRODRAFT_195131 [Helobdella robusta]|uniref:Tetraspanin n=1 Tax=Helobdella robusta TaxID=6412 RepID=T1FWS4_HELRO|nr:hypothetical protein HELRODRAFT_195131 [Helobdella robusta]ESN96988.1 hypothetical protein HELRODRAFT_195131 [Helobdella robusta]
MSNKGCSNFFRVVLVTINVLFFIIGVFMFSFGAALKANPIGLFSLFTDTFKSNFQIENALSGVTDTVGIFMVVVGCVVAALSLWGIVAAILVNKPMLIIFAIIVLLVLGAEIALIIVVVLYPNAINVWQETDFKSDDVYYYNRSAIVPPMTGMGRFWYLVQNKFDCCGVRNSNEFNITMTSDKRFPNCSSPSLFPFCNSTLYVPASCCKKLVLSQAYFTGESDFVNLAECVKLPNDKNPNYINSIGCLDAFYKSSAVIPIAIAAVTMGIMCFLCRSFEKVRNRLKVLRASVLIFNHFLLQLEKQHNFVQNYFISKTLVAYALHKYKYVPNLEHAEFNFLTIMAPLFINLLLYGTLYILVLFFCVLLIINCRKQEQE